VRPCAAQLSACKSPGTPFATAALAFVQGMRYKVPPERQRGRYIGGLLTPLEALAKGYGDCDTKALLYACLVDDGRGPEVILLRGPGHMVAAVECRDQAGGYTVRAFGKSFQVCECSSGIWPPGRISTDIHRDIGAGRYAPVRLRGGGGGMA